MSDDPTNKPTAKPRRVCVLTDDGNKVCGTLVRRKPAAPPTSDAANVCERKPSDLS